MARVLLFDSYDSFTYNLKDYLEQTGAEVTVIKNDTHTVDEIIAMQFDGIVLSPGPETPEKAGVLLELLKTLETKKPILGVCLGHQAIGLLYGIPLIKMKFPVHGKVSRIQCTSHPLFTGIPESFEVCRYHSLTLQNVPSSTIDIIATSDDYQVMAISHKSLPIWGVQFHPEAILTENGLKMIENWHNMVKLYS